MRGFLLILVGLGFLLAAFFGYVREEDSTVFVPVVAGLGFCSLGALIAIADHRRS